MRVPGGLPESAMLPSNESRLSCGAKLKYSQLEFYHTAGRTFAGLIEEGRRQLQALVRLRTIDHSLGPSPAGARRGTHRHWPYAGIVMPNGRTLRTPQRRRGPRATGPSLGKALRIEPNHPDGRRLQTRGRPRGCSQEDLVLGELRSLTNR